MIACVLRHAGHGPLHDDVVLAAGGRCPTLALVPGRPWRWRWQEPHRRRYLGFSGPVPGGRGRVRVLWRGPAVLLRHPRGWLLRAGGSLLLLRSDGVVQPFGPPHSRAWPPRSSRTPVALPPPR